MSECCNQCLLHEFCKERSYETTELKTEDCKHYKDYVAACAEGSCPQDWKGKICCTCGFHEICGADPPNGIKDECECPYWSDYMDAAEEQALDEAEEQALSETE